MKAEIGPRELTLVKPESLGAIRLPNKNQPTMAQNGKLQFSIQVTLPLWRCLPRAYRSNRQGMTQ
jgi:hypothetical protein